MTVVSRGEIAVGDVELRLGRRDCRPARGRRGHGDRLDGRRVRIEHFVVRVVGVIEHRGGAEARLRVDVGVVPAHAGSARDSQQDRAGLSIGGRAAARGDGGVLECLRRIGPGEITGRGLASSTESCHGGIGGRGRVGGAVEVIGGIGIEVVAIPLDAGFSSRKGRVLARRRIEQRGIGDHLPRHDRGERREEDEEHDDDHHGLSRIVPVLEAIAEAIAHRGNCRTTTRVPRGGDRRHVVLTEIGDAVEAA